MSAKESWVWGTETYTNTNRAQSTMNKLSQHLKQRKPMLKGLERAMVFWLNPTKLV
jgi:hypothetical protein